MGKSKALFLATIVASGASFAANAADLLPPPPPIEAPMPPPDFGGWYLRGDVGVGAVQGANFRSTLTPDPVTGTLPNGPITPAFASLGDSGIMGVGVGYQLNGWLRADLTGEYRTEAEYRRGIVYSYYNGTGGVGTGADFYTAGLGTALFMANAYVDLGTWRGITPYVGGGVGVAAHNLNGLYDVGGGVAQNTSPANFAWAVMAGLAFNITPNLKMDIGYRYVDMGDITSNPIQCLNSPCFHEQQSFHVASHDIRLGFRYAFAEPAPMPFLPSRPLVSKY